MNEDEHGSDAGYLCSYAFICGSIQCVKLLVCKFSDAHPQGDYSLTRRSPFLNIWVNDGTS